MAKNEDTKRLIAALVRNEVRKLLPEAVKQVLSGIISEAVIDLSPSPMGNSGKRVALTENSQYDEWPTMGARPMQTGNMAAMMGYGDMVGASPSRAGLITVDTVHTEHGTVPINPASIAPEVLAAMNKDYSGLMKAWDKQKNG